MARSQHAGPLVTGLHPLQKRDCVAALGVFAAGLTLFASWLPAHQYGDGAYLLNLFSSIKFNASTHRHAAYLPAGLGLKHGFEALGWALEPARILQLLSVLGAALGLAASFLIARCLGAATRAALLALLLFAFSPALFFFGRIVEVHALHFGASALVFAAVLAAAGRSRALCYGALVVLGPLLFLTHHSALLLYPGLALWAAYGLEPKPTWRTLARTNAAALLGLIAALLISAAIRGENLTELFADSQRLIETNVTPDRLGGAVSNFVIPLLLAWPLIGLGLKRLTGPARGFLLALLVTCLPQMLFFAWWAVPERGAYLLGYLPVLIGAGALGLDRALQPKTESAQPSWPYAVLGAALAIQLGVSVSMTRDFASQGNPAFQNERFATLAQAMADEPGPKFLVTLDPTAQSPCAAIDNLYEVVLINALVAAPQTIPAAEFGTWVGENFEGFSALRDQQIPLFYDRIHPDNAPKQAKYLPFVSALEQAIQDTYQVESLQDGAVWRITEIKARPQAEEAP